jgi:hypothetical protein
MTDGRIFLKIFRASLFNDDLSNEPNFGRIHLAGQYLSVNVFVVDYVSLFLSFVTVECIVCAAKDLQIVRLSFLDNQCALNMPRVRIQV